MTPSNSTKQEPDEQADGKGNYREVIGTVLFELLWFGLDIRFVYPESHVEALWYGLAGVAIAVYRHTPSLDWSIRGIAGLAVLGLLTQEFVLPPIPRVETETHGWLIPANDPSPPNPCPRMPVPSNAIAVYLGSNVAWTTRNVQMILNFRGNPVIGYQRNKEGNITFTGDLFGSDGNLIARIVRGEFHLVQSELSYEEREDRSTLALYDPKGNEILYLRFLNPAAILVRGTFYEPNLQRPLIIAEDRMIAPNGATFEDSCFDGAQAIFSFQ